MVAGRKLIVFFDNHIFIASKISIPTEDTADLNVKHFKHNVIATKPIEMPFQITDIFARACTCALQHRCYATFWFSPNFLFLILFYLHVGGRTIYRQKESFEL